MKKTLLSCLLSLYAVNSYAENSIKNWDTTDKILMGAYVSLNVIDTLQTKKALDKGGYEMNPILGKHPSVEKIVAVKALTTAAIYYIADEVPEYRTAILGSAVVVQSIVVNKNRIECKVGWGF